MNEREKALRLAQALDRQLTHPEALPEGADTEEQALLHLAGQLSGRSPLAPTGPETAQLRRRFEQARAAGPHSAVTGGRMLRAALYAGLILAVFLGLNFLISDLLKIPRPAIGGPASLTATPAGKTATQASVAPPAPTGTPLPAVFPAQSQEVGGLTLELRDASSLGSSLRVTLCYAPPDERTWRLEEVSLATVQGQTPFYPSSAGEPQPGPDGLVCEPFTAALPKDGVAGSLDISARRLVALRQTTPDCAAVNAQLAQDYPGLVLRCDTSGGFAWSVESTPEGMDPGRVRRLEHTYVDYDVRSGPWLFRVLPTQVARSENTGVPDPVVVPATCQDVSVLPSDPQQAGAFPEIPAGVAGLGSLQSGDFTFNLVLACDPSFSRLKMAGDDRSEINGLGVVLAVGYTGQPAGGGVDYSGGVWPFVTFTSNGGSLNRGSWFGQWDGLYFPGDVRPDFTQSDVRLRYLVRLRAPGGQIEGAALAFTLQREPEGYRPVDVRVEPLVDAERQSIEADPNAPLPFPTLAAPAVSFSPENQALLDLIQRWQQPLISSPGWVHLRWHSQMARGNDLFGGLKEYYSDEWYQVDAQGQVITMVHVDSTPDGAPMQQTVNANGKSVNLTYGMTGDFKPYPLDLAYSVRYALESGQNLKRMETTIDGRPVIVLAVPGVITRREAVDAASGAWLYSESVQVNEGEDPLTGGTLSDRMTIESAERLDAPPPDVQALLGKEFTGYTPPAPIGTPAPQGFDPSKSKLAMHLVPGDRFDAPSFWYGDITAEDYLLGRVNLGSTPGGSCARSADGLKLAFNFMTSDGAGSITSQSLHWLDLGSIQTVQTAAPEISNIGTLAWSPREEQLAFFGCQENQTNCGLYRLDPATGQVDRLVPEVYTGWPVLWSPDGGQMAFVNTLDEKGTFTVIDFSTGQVVYQGLFNPDAWQPPDDSPTHAWGVTFPRGQEGSACFDPQ